MLVTPHSITILIPGFIGLNSTMEQSYIQLCIFLFIYPDFYSFIFCSFVAIVGYACFLNNSCFRLYRPWLNPETKTCTAMHVLIHLSISTYSSIHLENHLLCNAGHTGLWLAAAENKMADLRHFQIW